MSEMLVAVFVVFGTAFMVLAAVGVTRLPDLFTRMQAATKAGAAGAGLLLIAVAVAFSDFGLTLQALLVAAFVVLTAPVAAHTIARAAYRRGVPLWEGTRIDELREARARRGNRAPDED